jgi:FMN-dependent NADH-azoreductase
MKTLLKIQASIYGNQGQSSQLADRFVQQWLANNPDGRVITRDLNTPAIPHLTAESFKAFATSPAERTPQQQSAVDYSDGLIAELQSADVIALAVPMYNFSVPSTVRAYFDHIGRVGVTFRYTANGPEGLIKGKKAYVFLTRGGAYAGSTDTQTPYLQQFLGFIGITDVEFIYAQGLSMGEEVREKSLTAARHSIAKLAEFVSAAA